jgi:hypothetical protein
MKYRIYLIVIILMSFIIYACEDHIVSDCEIVSPPEGLRATFRKMSLAQPAQKLVVILKRIPRKD